MKTENTEGATQPTKQVLITFRGDKTFATLLTQYSGDVRARTAMAAFNPEDDRALYHPYEGARIALARLFGLEPFPKDPEPQFERGDLVRIKAKNESRGLRPRSLGRVVWKSPNKMTPYLVKIIEDAETPSWLQDGSLKENLLVMPAEMVKLEVKDADE